MPTKPAASVWRGIATRRELLAVLAEIRRDGVAEVEQTARKLYAIAVPLPDGAGGVAALGAYLPIDAPRDGLDGDLRRAAAQIEERAGLPA